MYIFVHLVEKTERGKPRHPYYSTPLQKKHWLHSHQEQKLLQVHYSPQLTSKNEPWISSDATILSGSLSYGTQGMQTFGVPQRVVVGDRGLAPQEFGLAFAWGEGA